MGKTWKDRCYKRWWSQKAGIGKFWKRLLHKVRRRAFRDDHQRGLREKESEINWKGM